MNLFIGVKNLQLNFFLDASGNPVTQQVQSIVVTDASGNPVTGM